MVKIPTRVLLVDDEKDFVEMLSLRLQEAGEKVSAAYSGKECLDTLEKTNIDVVVLDIKMPGMDGMETLGEIRKRFPYLFPPFTICKKTDKSPSRTPVVSLCCILLLNYFKLSNYMLILRFLFLAYWLQLNFLYNSSIPKFYPVE